MSDPGLCSVGSLQNDGNVFRYFQMQRILLLIRNGLLIRTLNLSPILELKESYRHVDYEEKFTNNI